MAFYRLFAPCQPGLETVVRKELLQISRNLPAISTASYRDPIIVDGGVQIQFSQRDQHGSILHAILACMTTVDSARIRVAGRSLPFAAKDFATLERKFSALCQSNGPLFPFLPSSGRPLHLSVSCSKSKIIHSGAVKERIIGWLKNAQLATSFADDRSGASTVVDMNEGSGTIDSPQLTMHVRIHHDQVEISFEACGRRLSKRGMRQNVVEGCLRESLAASCLRMADLHTRRNYVLWDPMSGSGTFLLEMLLQPRQRDLSEVHHSIAKGKNIPKWDLMFPNILHSDSSFAFEHWQSEEKNRQNHFDTRRRWRKGACTALHQSIVDGQLMDNQCEQFRCVLFGSDIRHRAISALRSNASRMSELLGQTSSSICLAYDEAEWSSPVPTLPVMTYCGDFEIAGDQIRRLLDSAAASTLPEEHRRYKSVLSSIYEGIDIISNPPYGKQVTLQDRKRFLQYLRKLKRDGTAKSIHILLNTGRGSSNSPDDWGSLSAELGIEFNPMVRFHNGGIPVSLVCIS